MGAQGGLGQQYDGLDEQNELSRWPWPALGFAQMSKMSFPSAVALNMPIAPYVAMMHQMGVQSCLGQQKKGQNKQNQLPVSTLDI